MRIIKLQSDTKREMKKERSKNSKNNKGAYNKLKQIMVPRKMKLSLFRKYYKPVLSIKQKEVLIKMGINPWSVEGLKYVGDCKRYGINLGEKIEEQENIKFQFIYQK